uniref:TPR_REGION domain-containing protein n=1 Tax=Caenorhabditis japonica TaxID=281687 RepID=A0A8R1EFB9_CAEJA
MNVTVSSREEDDDIVEKMIKSALVTIKLGQYEEAAARFEEILETGTSNFQLLARIYMWYGRVCRKLKKYTKALEFFDRELCAKQLYEDHQGACDVFRRIAELCLKIGDFPKAKRTAEEFVAFASKKECEQFVEQARTLQAVIYLEGFQQNLEEKPEDRKKLLEVASDHIAALKSSKDVESPILMLEAKCTAFEGKHEEANALYKKCIEMGTEAEDFVTVYRAYFEMAMFTEQNFGLCVIDGLKNAVFYATKYGTPLEAASYKVELAKQLLRIGPSRSSSVHQAYLLCTEALEIARNESSSLIKPALLTISKCLSTLGKRRQAAYFIVLGSVLTVEQDLDEFYKQIDELMTVEKMKTPGDADVQLTVDASLDPAPNETAAKFTVKLEHTTTVETWRIVVKEFIEAATVKPEIVEEQKENEPVDFLDLIFKMNSRMDDQRTELPATFFQRPVSQASSSKATKSHKLFPGLRGNLQKLSKDVKDKTMLNKILKRSKKSNVSLNSDSNSTQQDDT